MTTTERRLFGEFDPLWISRFGRTATLLTVVCMISAVLALIGRYTQQLSLATWVSRSTVRPMQVFTASAFLVLGLAILIGLRGTPKRWGQVTARILASLTAGLGLAVLLSQRDVITLPRWFGTGITVPDISSGEEAGIPASNEGVMLMLLALAILLLTFRRPLLSKLGQAVAVVVVTIGGVVTVAFVYGDPTLSGFPFGSGRMAISAAVTAALLGVAIIVSRPETGFVAPLTSPWSGGILLRRLLPFVLILPPAAVALMLSGLSGIERPRLLAWLAVVASILLAAGLLATAASVNQAGLSLETAHDLSDRAEMTVKHGAALADELRSLLVRDVEKSNGLTYAVRYRPAEGWLAGDAAVIQRLDRSRLGLAIVDVAGHGRVPALTALRLSDLILHSMKSGMAPSRAVASVMWVIESNGDMATAVVAEVDSTTGAMRYVVAGHPPVLIHRADGSVERLEPTGPLLFSGLDRDWDEGLAALSVHDTLVIYTDGVADPQEAEDVNVASVQNLSDALRSSPPGDVEDLAEWCLSEASGRARGRLRDDATVVVLRRADRV